jgi:homoserine O-acetyltransferase
VEQRLAAPFDTDANDFVYQWEASRDYNPAPLLERIRARVLAINAADDERNPPETGLMQAAIRRVPQGRLVLIPASAETLGHATTGQARFWREELRAFLRELD